MALRKGVKAKLTKILDLTPSVRELYFTPEGGFEFKAGQFVMIDMNDETGKKVQRAYSVASSDKDTKEFKLVIKFYEFGVASKWVQTLKGGEDITFSGPFGKFLFKEPPEERVIFVCTSTGLAPLYSMLVSQGPSHKNVQYIVYMGVWNTKEIFYAKELEAARKGTPKLDIHFVLDKPEAGWTGPTGYVTDHIAKLDLNAVPTQFYICGNPAMIKSVREMLQAKNFPKEKVHTESYG